jgi:hypothetical protein
MPSKTAAERPDARQTPMPNSREAEPKVNSGVQHTLHFRSEGSNKNLTRSSSDTEVSFAKNEPTNKQLNTHTIYYIYIHTYIHTVHYIT